MSQPREDVVANANLPMPLWELVALIAALMSLTAFAIDIMLPALDDVAETYQLARSNDQQLVLFAYLLGYGVPQLFFGPWSDSRGRRGLLQICLIGYIITAFACMATATFEWLLLSRFVQGVFSSGIRVVAVSIVRDLVAGRAMARVMSLVMTIFMIVPIIAPAIGEGLIVISSWQWSFGVLGIAGILCWVWVQFRLPETLAVEDRHELSVREVSSAYWNVLRSRVTMGYMAASGVIFGALFAFIAASEQIFSDAFNEGSRFALWFALIGVLLAIGNLVNARMVERFGMRRLSHAVMICFIILSVLNIIAMHVLGENFPVFITLFSVTFACFGLMGANFSAIAMEPQGKNAGTASAVYGFATTTVASVFGWLVASSFDGHVTPILFGYAVLGLISLFIVLLTERGKLFETGQ